MTKNWIWTGIFALILNASSAIAGDFKKGDRIRISDSLGRESIARVDELIESSNGKVIRVILEDKKEHLLSLNDVEQLNPNGPLESCDDCGECPLRSSIESASSIPVDCNFGDLPSAVLIELSRHLDNHDLKSCLMINKHWRTSLREGVDLDPGRVFRYAPPIVSLSKPTLKWVHKEIETNHPDFYAIGGSQGQMYLVKDRITVWQPNKNQIVPPFIISRNSPERMSQLEAIAYCQQRGARLPTGAELEALQSMMSSKWNYWQYDRNKNVIPLSEMKDIWSSHVNPHQTFMGLSMSGYNGSVGYQYNSDALFARCVIPITNVRLPGASKK